MAAKKKPTPRTRKPGKAQGAKVVGMSAFFTRARANEGVTIPLHTPEGAESGHWLEISGIDGDAFQKAKARQPRIMAEIAVIENEEEREAAAMVAMCNLLAVVVKSWTFNDPAKMPSGELYECNVANASMFLQEAPQIRTRIDEIISSRAGFYRLQAKN